MNRTTLFLGLAGGLALVALVLGLPNRGQPHSPPPDPAPLVDPGPSAAAVKDGSIHMQGRLSHPYLLSGQSDVFVTVDLSGQEIPGAARSKVNLALVIDRSGSMAGSKLEQAKQAARQLVNQLHDGDRLAIVHYGSDVRTLGSMEASAANKEAMYQFIDRIFDEGGTNISDALEAGRSQVLAAASDYKVNRIILITDGQPTEGLTDPRELQDEVRQIHRGNVSLSAIGVGTDFNEELLQSFAELGSGSYGYLQDASQLATIFQKDLNQAATLVARNVELGFTLPEGVELGEVLGYQSQQSGRTVHVSLPDFAAGQSARVVARLTVHAAQAGKALDVAGLELRYRDLLKDTPVDASAQLSAMVTTDAEQVAQNQDKAATVYAVRAQTAKNTYEAAEALRRGDRGEAHKLLEANQSMFEKAEQVAGAAAVADDLQEQRSLRAKMDAAQTPEAIENQVKSSKLSARKAFGRTADTY